MKNLSFRSTTLLFLLTAFFSITVAAQKPQTWDRAQLAKKDVGYSDGSNNMANSYAIFKANTGRLGLGTLTPANKLHVVGGYKQYKLYAGGETLKIDFDTSSTGGTPLGTTDIEISKSYANNTASRLLFSPGYIYLGLDSNNTLADSRTVSILINKAAKDVNIKAAGNNGDSQLSLDGDGSILGGGVLNGILTDGTNTNSFTFKPEQFEFIQPALFSTKVGVGLLNPLYDLQVDSTIAGKHFVSTQNAATVTATAEAGAGSGATFSGTGSDHAGTLTLVTGTTVVANTDLATVTYKFPFPSGFTGVSLTPSNANAAALTGAKSIYVTSDATGFVIKGGTTALTDGTTYIWKYVVMR